MGETREEAGIPGRRGQLLIVEDEPSVRELLSRLLSAEHEVAVAADGRQALAWFAAGPYDAVLLDVAMPGMPGDQVARQLRDSDPSVVLVAASGWPLAPEEERWRVFDFLVKKPFAAEDIVQAARRAVALHQARQKNT